MLNYYDYKELFDTSEVLEYLRKSRSDDPMMSVEEVLTKHETMLDEWVMQNFEKPIPESNKLREVVSGESIEDRLAFQDLLKRIESPKIKAVLVVELQRLGRPDLEEIGKITKIFRYTNTMVITPQRAYNLRDEIDRDYFERELKRGNEYLEYQKKIMNRGRQLSVSQGNYIGSLPPYGYNKIWVTEGKKEYPTLAENKEQADVVRLIFDMYTNQGKGVHLIAKHLDELHIPAPKGSHWSAHALKAMLQNVHYIGKVKWNYRKVITIVEDSEIVKTRPRSKSGEYLTYEGKHPAIISDELFTKTQEMIGRNHRAKPDTTVRNPFAGIFYCKCGRAMSLRTYKKDGIQRTPPRLVCDDQAHCGTGSCLYEEMLDRVCEILKQCIKDFKLRMNEETNDSANLHAKLIKNLEKKLAELEQKELAQWEAQTDPNSENKMPPYVFKQLNAKLLKEKEETQKALITAHESMPEPVDYQETVSKFQDALDALLDENKSGEEKNKLLKACIKRIYYHRDKIERVNGSWTSPPIEIDVQLMYKQ